MTDRIEETSLDAVRAAVPDPAEMKAIVIGDLATLRALLLALAWASARSATMTGRSSGAFHPDAGGYRASDRGLASGRVQEYA